MTDTGTQREAPDSSPEHDDPRVEPTLVEDLDLPDEEPTGLRGGHCRADYIPGITYVNP